MLPAWAGSFSCSYNNLTSLVGSPSTVGGYFSCSNNKLTSLEGAPKFTRGDFICQNNNIFSFHHFPRFDGTFNCYGNPIYNVWILFENEIDVEFLNDYDALRFKDGEPIIIYDRLNAFLEETNRPTVETVEGYKMIH